MYVFIMFIFLAPKAQLTDWATLYIHPQVALSYYVYPQVAERGCYLNQVEIDKKPRLWII